MQKAQLFNNRLKQWKLAFSVSDLKRIISTTDSVTFPSAHFGSGSGSIHLNYVTCSGGEKSLLDCTYSIYAQYCRHNQDVGVRCQSMNNYSIEA